MPAGEKAFSIAKGASTRGGGGERGGYAEMSVAPGGRFRCEEGESDGTAVSVSVDDGARSILRDVAELRGEFGTEDGGDVETPVVADCEEGCRAETGCGAKTEGLEMFFEEVDRTAKRVGVAGSAS